MRAQYVLHFPRGEKYVSLLRPAADPGAAAALDAERARLRALVRTQLAEAALLGDADEGAALAARQGLAYPSRVPNPPTGLGQAAGASGAPGQAAAEDAEDTPGGLADAGGSVVMRTAAGDDGSGGAEEAPAHKNPEQGPGSGGKRRRASHTAAGLLERPAREHDRSFRQVRGQPGESSKRRKLAGTAADVPGLGSGFDLLGAGAGALGASDDFFLDVDDAAPRPEVAGRPWEPWDCRTPADAGATAVGPHRGAPSAPVGESAPCAPDGTAARRAPADPGAGRPAGKTGLTGGRAGRLSAKVGAPAGQVRPPHARVAVRPMRASHGGAGETPWRTARVPGAVGQLGQPGSGPAGALKASPMDTKRSASQSALPGRAVAGAAGREGIASGRPTGGSKLRKRSSAGKASAAAPRRAGADAGRRPNAAAAEAAQASATDAGLGSGSNPGRPGAPAEVRRRTRAEGGRKRRRP